MSEQEKADKIANLINQLEALGCGVDEDNYGQIVIYTNHKVRTDVLQPMVAADYE